jgi:membrane-bound lytic murein transglycosylase D
MRLLLVNKLRFNDWQLSVLAYNSGERFVQEAITRSGTRDPWALTAANFGSEENREYLPKLMAGILVMRNPAAVQ